MNFVHVIFNNMVPTSNKIYCVSITKINCLILFGGEIEVHSEKRKKRMKESALCGQYRDFFNIKETNIPSL
jgi:hypothetical protein